VLGASGGSGGSGGLGASGGLPAAAGSGADKLPLAPGTTPPAGQTTPPAKARPSPTPSRRSAAPEATQPRPAKTRPAPPQQTQPPAPAEAKRPAREETRRPAPAKPRPPASSETELVEPLQPQEPKPPEPKPRPKLVRPPQFAWAYPEESPPGEPKPLTNAPAVDATGRIFLHVQGRLVSLQEQAGRPQVCWEYVTGSHAPGPATLDGDGSIRLHCTDGCLHCVTSEGRQTWPPANVGQPLGYAAPVVDQQGNTFISAFGGGLIKVDVQGKVLPPGGRPGRYFRSRQKFDAAAVIHQDVLYVGSEEGYMVAIRLDEQKGRNLWDQTAERGHAGWYVRCWPALTENGTLVVAGSDEHLHGFAPDGTETWRTEMPGQTLASPVIDPLGQIYVGLSQSRRGQQPRGGLVSVDGNSHKIRWQYQAAGPVESTPVIGDDDVIYFGDNTGLVHAADLSGKALWTAQVGSAVRSAGTIIAPERVAFGLDNETLVVLKCSSRGLAPSGWPKIGGTLGQCGLSSKETQHQGTHR